MLLTLTDGSIVDERYRICRVLGTGGMGTVYEADEIELNRRVAIKFIRMENDSAPSAEAITRMTREAKALAEVQHQSIVGFLRLGVWQDRYPYLVMEYVEGQSLAEKLEKQGALPWNEVLTLVKQLCAGLSLAHQLGIVHRDIKPQNILLTGGGQTAKLLDFGLCRLTGSEYAVQKLTQTGNLVGSAYYMAPEIASGESLTSAADIYSLGCVMFQLLTGILPFEADTAYGTIYKQMNEVAPGLSEVTPGYRFANALETLLAGCLAKQAGDRPTAQDILTEAERILSTIDKRVVIFAPNKTVRTASTTKKNLPGLRSPWPIVALSLVSVAALALFSKFAMHDQLDQSENTTQTKNRKKLVEVTSYLPLQRMSEVANRAGRDEEALEWNDLAIKRFKSDKVQSPKIYAGLLVSRADILCNLQKYKEALAAVQEAVAIYHPDSKFDSTYVSGIYLMGSLQVVTGEVEKGGANYLKAHAYYQKAPFPDVSFICHLKMDAGDAAAHNGDLAAAARLYSESIDNYIKEDPESSMIHVVLNRLATIQFQQKKYKQAKVSYLRYIDYAKFALNKQVDAKARARPFIKMCDKGIAGHPVSADVSPYIKNFLTESQPRQV